MRILGMLGQFLNLFQAEHFQIPLVHALVGSSEFAHKLIRL